MALLNIETDDVTLTKAAAEAVQALLAKRNLEGYALRLYIAGGGCSGFQYGMALENNIRDNDKVYAYHDVQLVVDEVSYNYLRGATIDYVDELMGSGFQIENPNAVASCGCGQSFRTSETASSSASEASC